MPHPGLQNGLSFPDDFNESLMNSSPVALLCSGGVESAILAGTLTQHFQRVFPIYIRFGLHWESAELDHLKAYLTSIADERLAQLTVLEQPVKDVYKSHWSTTGEHVPDASTDDSAVYLPGRNILLISKASVWCTFNGVSIIALGALSTNPFPDATDAFFENFERTLGEGLEQSLRLIRPFKAMPKDAVIRMGESLPLHLSFSCIQPVHNNLHCGICNKCAERRLAFREANVLDATEYASAQTETEPSPENNLCIR